MSAAALSGWACATVAFVVAVLAVARLREQARCVARAAHELRGGLCVAGLALEARAVDAAQLQLRRAGRALAELDRASAAPHELLDLSALLRSVAAGWPRDVRVDAPDGLRVRGDAAALAQACTNLVANAVEHGAPPVLVRGRMFGATARIEVSDAGPGLPAPVDALVAAARTGRGRRGHGLAITAGVAERHGGRLGSGPAESGASLVLELPAARDREPA